MACNFNSQVCGGVWARLDENWVLPRKPKWADFYPAVVEEKKSVGEKRKNLEEFFQ